MSFALGRCLYRRTSTNQSFFASDAPKKVAGLLRNFSHDKYTRSNSLDSFLCLLIGTVHSMRSKYHEIPKNTIEHRKIPVINVGSL